jgi:hypothetical protein
MVVDTTYVMRGDAMTAIYCATYSGPTPLNDTSTLYNIDFGTLTPSGVAADASRCRMWRSDLCTPVRGVAGIKPCTCKDGLKHGCRSAGKAAPVR